MGQRYGYRSCKTSTWYALMLDDQDVKKDFPIFSNHDDLYYFDSASTTQKPQAVIDSVSSFSLQEKSCKKQINNMVCRGELVFFN